MNFVRGLCLSACLLISSQGANAGIYGYQTCDHVASWCYAIENSEMIIMGQWFFPWTNEYLFRGQCITYDNTGFAVAGMEFYCY